MFEGMRRRFGNRLERRIVPRGFDRVRYIAPVRPEAATALVAAVYEQLSRDFQLLAPLTLASPLPTLLAARWTILRETVIAGAAPRLEKELVAEAVSKANACPYCVAAHALMVRGGGLDGVGQALARGDAEAIANPRLRSIATWALNTRSPDRPAVLSPPFDERSASEFVGTAVAFHTTNRLVDVFLEASPFASPAGLKLVAWSSWRLPPESPYRCSPLHHFPRIWRGLRPTPWWLARSPERRPCWTPSAGRLCRRQRGRPSSST